jgi:hypothetical protein
MVNFSQALMLPGRDSTGNRALPDADEAEQGILAGDRFRVILPLPWCFCGYYYGDGFVIVLKNTRLLSGPHLVGDTRQIGPALDVNVSTHVCH